eukprot:921937-Pelagomonas_calceolata.AAC.1
MPHGHGCGPRVMTVTVKVVYLHGHVGMTGRDLHAIFGCLTVSMQMDGGFKKEQDGAVGRDLRPGESTRLLTIELQVQLLTFLYAQFAQLPAEQTIFNLWHSFADQWHDELQIWIPSSLPPRSPLIMCLQDGVNQAGGQKCGRNPAYFLLSSPGRMLAYPQYDKLFRRPKSGAQLTETIRAIDQNI